VTPAVTTATTAPLAFTGTDAVATSALGAGVLCLGGLLVLGSRKRRRNTLV
jgi:LPXTG-motif cell wall-anchored protein